MSRQSKMELDAFDRKEGRVRLYRDEFEDTIQLLASIRTIGTCLNKVERVARLHKRTWSKLKCGYAMLFNAFVEMTTKISIHQYKTVTSNNGYIAYQQSRHADNYAMDEDDYYKLVLAARNGQCRGCLNCMDRGEWSRCRLAMTLDTVPCKPGRHEKQQIDKGSCPYAVVDMEAFEKQLAEHGLCT